MSNSLDITMDQGSTLTYTFYLTNEDTTAKDCTGYDARLQVRKTYGSSTVEINCTLANSKLTWTNAAGGVLKLVLAPSDTSSISFIEKDSKGVVISRDNDTLTCVYDLEIIDTLSKVYKPARGTFTLNREATR